MASFQSTDWICTRCNSSVAASKPNCFKCLAPKPMQGMLPPGMLAAQSNQQLAVSAVSSLSTAMIQAAASGHVPNPREAKQRAEAIARANAQALELKLRAGNAEDSAKQMADDIGSGKKRRKRRWGDDNDKVTTLTVVPQNLTADQQKAYLLHVQIEETSKRLKMPDLGIPRDVKERSPSPEPIYSHDGKRMNTREYRTRKKLETQRHELIEQLKKVNPSYKPPGDYRPPEKKIMDKIMIPQDDHPHIGFMGLLIGPRGNTLKKIQQETRCKVMIRGRGTEKEGKGRFGRLPQQGDGEPMHAIIEAPSEAMLKKCCDKIHQIIKVGMECPDGQNELKRMQLRELASLNGTLRDDEIAAKCKNCGSMEHRTWECPQELNFVNTVTCTRCGGKGHVVADCTVDLTKVEVKPAENKEKMDSEYMALMSELGEGGAGGGGGGGSGAPPPPSGAPPPPSSAPPPPSGAPPTSGGSNAAPPPWASRSGSSTSSSAPPWASRAPARNPAHAPPPSQYGGGGGYSAPRPPQQQYGGGGYGGGYGQQYGGGYQAPPPPQQYGGAGGYGGYAAPPPPGSQPPPPGGAPPPPPTY
eukprot:m.110198 g.110198  ORF g.110198 m.110198 type:complete len:584 (-) comp16977_c0_seq1:102-1853(-)